MYTKNKSDSVIEVTDLVKRFDIYDTKLDILKEVLFRRHWHKKITVLDGISFMLHPGEVVGILGRNGAGKSTLLRIIAGTLRKTSGEVRIKGRIGAILELGAGFNPDYSGHDNIFMGGLCLGLSRKEIEAKYNWIVDFSGLGKFIERPVRTYSTGMHARLAFSVAVCIEPDILIVDEALAVGDAKFQRKCFDHMEKIRAQGSTILFVSHDPRAITSLCDRAILLGDGRITLDDDPRIVIREYTRQLFGTSTTEITTTSKDRSLAPGSNETSEQTSTLVDDEAKSEQDQNREVDSQPSQSKSVSSAILQNDELRYGSREAEIVDVALRDKDGNRTSILECGQPCSVYYRVRANTYIEEISYGFRLHTIEGIDLYGTKASLHDIVPSPLSKGNEIDVLFTFDMRLAPGRYLLTVAAASYDEKMYDRRADVLAFEVLGDVNCYTTSLFDLDATVTLT